MKVNHKLKYRRIYIDTNVLIGNFRGIKTDVQAMDFLFKMQDFELYTSTLAISQTISTLQGKKKDKSYRQQIVNYIKRLKHKIKIVGFSEKDIDTALELEGVDIEDNIQFVLGKKMGCYTYITNNIKDFRYSTIVVVDPRFVKGISY